MRARARARGCMHVSHVQLAAGVLSEYCESKIGAICDCAKIMDRRYNEARGRRRDGLVAELSASG